MCVFVRVFAFVYRCAMCVCMYPWVYVCVCTRARSWEQHDHLMIFYLISLVSLLKPTFILNNQIFLSPEFERNDSWIFVLVIILTKLGLKGWDFFFLCQSMACRINTQCIFIKQNCYKISLFRKNSRSLTFYNVLVHKCVFFFWSEFLPSRDILSQCDRCLKRDRSKIV